MSKIKLSPDLARDMREIMKRLDALEADYSGPRFFGPYTTGALSVAAGATTTGTWTHNLGWTAPGPTKMGVLPWVVLTSGAVVPSVAVSAFAANAVTFAISGASSGTANFAIYGYVLIL